MSTYKAQIAQNGSMIGVRIVTADHILGFEDAIDLADEISDHGFEIRTAYRRASESAAELGLTDEARKEFIVDSMERRLKLNGKNDTTTAA